MIEIVKGGNIEEEFLQCSSCLCNNDGDDADIFRLIIGKNMRQTMTIKLCAECLKELQIKINDLDINGEI